MIVEKIGKIDNNWNTRHLKVNNVSQIDGYMAAHPVQRKTFSNTEKKKNFMEADFVKYTNLKSYNL